MPIKYLLGRLFCYAFGHNWSEWEQCKYYPGTERNCPVCKLHQGDGSDNDYFWMRPSKNGGWVKAYPLRK